MKRSVMWRAGVAVLIWMLCCAGVAAANVDSVGVVGDCMPDEPTYTPDMPQYHCDEGGTYYGKKQYDLAVLAYRRALTIDPGYSNAYYGLAFTYRAQGRLDLAIVNYGEVIRLEPTYAQPYASRAELYQCMGRFDEARGDLDSFVEHYGQYPVPYTARGDFFMERREYARAAQDYAVAIEKNPKSAEVYVKYAEALLLCGEVGEARLAFERAATLKGME